jgi:tetratricopeptide (TPR) repeat protein
MPDKKRLFSSIFSSLFGSFSGSVGSVGTIPGNKWNTNCNIKEGSQKQNMARASIQGLEIVDKARLSKGWNKHADIWCQLAFTTKATLKRFWRREHIKQDTFIEICRAVGLNRWEEIIERYQTPPKEPDPDFVGREDAIAHLDNLVQAGAKIIVIQGEGGVGKTKLARQYFDSCAIEFIELWMPRERQNIVSCESIVEEWLRRHFYEEPGLELGINLDRLRRRLRDGTRKIGILIDNLEPALDRNGRFIENHRSYAELFSVLSDSSVKCLTLITSRERLYEAGIEINYYVLKGLNDSAWRQFFQRRNLTDSAAISEMCKAYGGNAKAMQIISGAVCTDFECDVDAYWRASKNDLLIEPELENLVVSQFNRLQEIDLEAYKLLYRLGCYRYQDVSFVKIEGLFCLLWDVPESQRRRVINRLCDRSLVECKRGKYWLHPVILAEASSRLRSNGDWQTTNRQAGEYWTNSVTKLEKTEDALVALEAYYHYLVIEDFDKAADVIIKQRHNKWGTNESLGRSFYKRGLLQLMITAINQVVDKLNFGYRSAKLYHTLGAIYWLSGDMHQAIRYCEEAKQISIQCLQSISVTHDTNTRKKLSLIEINALLTIGISKIGLWELEAAMDVLITVIQLCQDIDYEKYAPSALFYLGYLNSCLNKNNEALEISEYLYQRLPEEGLPSWVTEYRLSYLAMTYKNLGEIDKSFEIYHKVISYSEDSPFAQAKTKALSGLAQLYREKEQLQEALSYHQEAIRVLIEIRAKADLAEVYYQLGLTYQKMGQIDQSKENFNQAIALFAEMQAPKQIEKVKLAMHRCG